MGVLQPPAVFTDIRSVHLIVEVRICLLPIPQ